jgi:hypothetical protein
MPSTSLTSFISTNDDDDDDDDSDANAGGTAISVPIDHAVTVVTAEEAHRVKKTRLDDSS